MWTTLSRMFSSFQSCCKIACMFSSCPVLVPVRASPVPSVVRGSFVVKSFQVSPASATLTPRRPTLGPWRLLRPVPEVDTGQLTGFAMMHFLCAHTTTLWGVPSHDVCVRLWCEHLTDLTTVS